jgi:uncharacterized oxidoreductase
MVPNVALGLLSHIGPKVAPPWVRTELLSSQEEERAIPLDQFITDAMETTRGRRGQDPRCLGRSHAREPRLERTSWVDQFNDMIAAGPAFG